MGSVQDIKFALQRENNTLNGDDEKINFILNEIGNIGELSIELFPNKTKNDFDTFIKNPFIKEEIIQKKNFEEEYLCPIINMEQKIYPREINFKEYIKMEFSKPKYTLEIEKDMFYGDIIGFKEILSDNTSSKESSSLLRKASQTKDFIRGSTENLPFQPGYFYN
jgi:hypothetical protein